MKNKFLTLIAISALFFTACKTESVTPTDGAEKGDYQSFTSGSAWTYRTTTHIPGTNGQNDVETSVITMTSGIYYMDNKIFHKATSVTDNDPNKVPVYYGLNDNVYSMREVDETTGEQFTLPYLNADLAAGANWTTIASIPGSATQVQLKTTIIDKAIIKTVLGKTYPNVIHSQVDVQYKINNVFQTTLTYDFYVAKSVGMIGIYIKTPAAELAATELVSSSIK
jgi:hypothetical protein